jgi:hypothetical protein
MAAPLFSRDEIVVIHGLAARPELNGLTGTILRHFDDSGRWAVQLAAGGEAIKLKPDNLSRAFHVQSHCLRPALDAELHQQLVRSLSTLHYAVVDSLLCEEACTAFCHFLAEQKPALDVGDVAGGRAAAAYARITKQAAPRGDLMKFLTAAEASSSEPLKPVFAALDSIVQALQRAPELADEWCDASPQSETDSTTPPPPSPQRLRRDEMQITCYPGDGTRYVKHVDNNDGRKSGRRITCIVYANPGWQPGNGGELRLHVPHGSGVGGEAGVAGSARLDALGTDVPPKANRLVLFWSDARVPHEVLPTCVDRFALSVWYSS